MFFCLIPSLIFGQDIFKHEKNFFDAVKSENWEKAKKEVLFFEQLDVQELESQLNNEAKKKAFWVNYYNIYVQYLLVQNPGLFDNRDNFFKENQIRIAGHLCSFDMIEHGIIRRSKNKYSLGYFGKIFVEDFEERFRLENVDYRVHFALNCGAKSCPPVAFYDWQEIDNQLDQVSMEYLKTQVKLDKESNELYIPILAFWFKADFGGLDGIKTMLMRYDFDLLLSQEPDIKYLEYDWTLLTSNYIELTSNE